MSLNKELAFRLPVALGLAWLLAGCYTVLRHPTTEVTQAHGGDEQYADCASCHDQGFDEPLLRDPYGYASNGFWSYYGCPWWLYDCGMGYAYGDPKGPGWSGGGGGAYGRPERTDEDGRNVGSRGAVRDLPGRLPSVSPPGSPSVGAPSNSLRPSETPSSTPADQGQQEGRTMKHAPAPAPPANPPATPPSDSDKDKKKDRPAQDKS